MLIDILDLSLCPFNNDHSSKKILLVYIQEGYIRIDNNGTENKIRLFAVEHKNLLFTVSVLKPVPVYLHWLKRKEKTLLAYCLLNK